MGVWWHQKCLLGCTRLIKSRLTALKARSHCDGNGNGFVVYCSYKVYFYDNGIVAVMNGFSANIWDCSYGDWRQQLHMCVSCQRRWCHKMGPQPNYQWFCCCCHCQQSPYEQSHMFALNPFMMKRKNRFFRCCCHRSVNGPLGDIGISGE